VFDQGGEMEVRGTRDLVSSPGIELVGNMTTEPMLGVLPRSMCRPDIPWLRVRR
jgi:hypothetical protein